MIFAVETEELTLYVFPDEVAAVAYCEGIDVEAAIWAFWNDAGIPLSAKFTVLPQRRLFSVVNIGEYYLAHDPEFPQTPLLEILEEVKNVNGHPPLDSLSAIEQYIKAQSER